MMFRPVEIVGRVVADTKVVGSVVENITIDVIDNRTLRGLHDETMQADTAELAAPLLDGLHVGDSVSVLVTPRTIANPKREKLTGPHFKC
jgi:hypothetical protein